MEVADLAFGHGHELYAEKAKSLEKGCDVFLVAAQRLRASASTTSNLPASPDASSGGEPGRTDERR